MDFRVVKLFNHDRRRSNGIHTNKYTWLLALRKDDSLVKTGLRAQNAGRAQLSGTPEPRGPARTFDAIEAASGYLFQDCKAGSRFKAFGAALRVYVGFRVWVQGLGLRGLLQSFSTQNPGWMECFPSRTNFEKLPSKVRLCAQEPFRAIQPAGQHLLSARGCGPALPVPEATLERGWGRERDGFRFHCSACLVRHLRCCLGLGVQDLRGKLRSIIEAR